MSDQKHYISNMRTSGHILASTLRSVAERVKPGITGIELDLYAENEITKHDALPSFKNYQGYPSSLCVSINDEVVHGIPSKYKFKVGDVVSLDLGVVYNDCFTDSATTVIVTDNAAETAAEIKKKSLHHSLSKAELLLTVTEQSLEAGLAKVRSGAYIGDIGSAIQKYAETHHFGVVRELVGHGVGHAVHEEPSIPNFGKEGTGPILKTGQTIAIEPMITIGNWHIMTDEDGWTVRTSDGSLAAHVEHTILVTDDGYEILTME